MKEAGKYLVGILLAAVLLSWVLWGKDPKAIWAALQRASLPGLALAGALNLAHGVPRVWRWGALLRPVRPQIPFRPMFSAVIIGYMTTWIVPGRLGELVRPALLAGREGVPLGPCLGSILADRLLDGVTILVLFALAVLVDPLGPGAAGSVALIRTGALGLLVAVGSGLAVLLVLSAFRRQLVDWLGSRSKLVGWMGRTVLSFARGVEALRQPRLLVIVSLHSLLTWLVISLSTWVGLRACGAPLSFSAVLILMPLLALGVALPTPGNIGGYQVAMTFGLETWFGVDPAVAASAGILAWLVVVVPPILLGLLLLVVERISWRHLMAAARQIRTLGSADAGPLSKGRAVEGTP